MRESILKIDAISFFADIEHKCPVAVGEHTMTTIGDTESVAVVGGYLGEGRSLDILSSLL